MTLARLLLNSARQCALTDSAMISDIKCLQGALMVQKGNPLMAVDCFQVSRKFCTEDHRKSIIDQNEGAAWFLLEDYDRAILFFSRALYELKDEESADPFRVTRLYENLFAAAIESHNPQLANACYEKAQALRRMIGYEYPTDPARNLLKIALVCYRQSEPDSAIFYSLSAFSLLDGKNHSEQVIAAGIHQLMGKALVMKGQVMKAIPEFDAGLEMLDKDDYEVDRDQQEMKDLLKFRIQCDKAMALFDMRKMGNFSSAIDMEEVYGELLKAHDMLTGMVLAGKKVPDSIFDVSHLLYERILEVSYESTVTHKSHETDRLLRLSEEMKWMDARVQHQKPFTEPGKGELSDKIRSYERDLYYRQKRFLALEKKPGIDFLKESSGILDLKCRLDTTPAKGEQNSSWSSSLELACIDSIRSHLLEGEGLVSFIHAGNSILSVCISKDTASSFLAVYDTTLKMAITRFGVSLKKADPAVFESSGSILYKRLLGPFNNLLTRLKRIYVIADHPLQDIPVELIPVSRDSPGKPRLLVQDLEISYHGSISGWMESLIFPADSNQVNPSRTTSFLGYSPACIPGCGNTGLSFGCSEIDEIGEKFRDMGLESRICWDDVPGDEELMTEAGKATILHLVTHSSVNREHPGFSGFYLSGDEQHMSSDDPGHDGFLELGELKFSHLPCDLLVLSSCAVSDIDASKKYRDYTFPADLFSSGIKNVIYSLWNVSDRHTKSLMVSFYSHLLEGRDYVSALRLAKLDMLSDPEVTDPWLWGGFILRGR